MLFKNGLFILIFSLFICNSLLKQEEQEGKLLFVLEHFRHGARGSYKSFDYTEWKDILNEKWKGAGELSNLGMRQHYLLGVSIRNKYKDFISDVFNPNEVFIISSDVNRTLISAKSHLLGIYNKTNISTRGSIKNKNYSSIINDRISGEEEQLINRIFPIHIYDNKDLKYQLYRSEVCPGFEAFIKKISDSEEMKKMIIDVFEETNKNFGENLKKYIDQKIIDNKDYNSYFSRLKAICDTFIADYFDGRTLEDLDKTGINMEAFNHHCLNISLINVYFSYYGKPLEKSAQFGISPMFRDIFEFMEKRIKLDKENNSNKITPSAPKYVIVSGHDVSLAAFDLYLENKFNITYTRADYANNQIFELWKKEDKYYIRYLINLELGGEFEYDYFKKKVSEDLYSDDDIRAICNNTKKIAL